MFGSLSPVITVLLTQHEILSSIPDSAVGFFSSTIFHNRFSVSVYFVLVFPCIFFGRCPPTVPVKLLTAY